MKKFWRSFICMTLVMCLTLFLFTGCSGSDSGDSDKGKADGHTNEEVQTPDNEETQDQTDLEEQGDQGDKTAGDVVDTVRKVSIYYVDDQTAEIVSKSVEIRDEYDIWDALKESGILTENCELLSLTVNEAEKKMDLDFNSAVGDRVRSMGTTGETEIVGCIINTYLEAYGCEGIRLTEEGQAFQTSHGADLDGYSGKFTF